MHTWPPTAQPSSEVLLKPITAIPYGKYGYLVLSSECAIAEKKMCSYLLTQSAPELPNNFVSTATAVSLSLSLNHSLDHNHRSPQTYLITGCIVLIREGFDCFSHFRGKTRAYLRVHDPAHQYIFYFVIFILAAFLWGKIYVAANAHHLGDDSLESLLADVAHRLY